MKRLLLYLLVQRLRRVIRRDKAYYQQLKLDGRPIQLRIQGVWLEGLEITNRRLEMSRFGRNLIDSPFWKLARTK